MHPKDNTGVNDIVVDMFNGSGTSCLVAKKLKRRYIGFELNKEFCDLSIERIKKLN